MKEKNEEQVFRNIRALFETNLKSICIMARDSHDADGFKSKLKAGLDLFKASPERGCVDFLIENDGKRVHELSSGNFLTISTISRLWAFLKGNSEDVSEDFLTDIYHQFMRLHRPASGKPERRQVEKWAERWPDGLDADVMEIRSKNKERIINWLVDRIDKHHSGSSKYCFSPDMPHEAKVARVEQWWSDHRFQLAMAARSVRELNKALGHTLSEETLHIYNDAREKGIPVFVTPYYLSLLNTGPGGYDDMSIRSYVLYSRELVDAFGDIRAWEKEDSVRAGEPNAAGWLLPEGHNIHRRYPDVAILIPDSMGRACGGLCASCQRMYDFQSKRLNFNFEALGPTEKWDHKLQRLMKYFEEDSHLCDILITGGDALMSQNKTLRNILKAILKMAESKRRANLQRPDGEKYAEMKRVRLGTRLPVYLPMRIDDELLEILSEFREEAEKIGISQCYVQTHFQTPLEMTPEAREAVSRILSTGWKLTNQTVFNVASSRRGHTAKLRKVLADNGIFCYYTFSVKGFKENRAVFAPNSRSVQESMEEKNVCFPSTDRNVLNLPGIGKSMTFRLAGIMEDGCRVLEFDHDGTRAHSPVVENLGKVYILENKSLLSYLRQLENLGENADEYASIWEYDSGRTEPRDALYSYPPQDFRVTAHLTNLGQPSAALSVEK